MDRVNVKLTVFFEDPFWVGAVLRTENGKLSVCRIVFGTEPKDYEVFSMSYQNFKEAMELAPECKFYTTAGGKSEDEIRKAEELLGVKFSKQCREFYAEYGYLSFYGNEIFGIDPEDDSGELEGNSVAYALNDRAEYGLPDCWIPVCNFDDGYMAYLDYSSLNKDGEPCVIVAFFNGSEYQVEETIAEYFGEFVFQLVKQQLEE